MSHKSVTKRIAELNTELELLERERNGLVATFRANRLTEIRNGKIPARDLGVLRPSEKENALRREVLLREHLVADEAARREGLMV